VSQPGHKITISLAELVRREHSNVPVGAWGFFFPVVIALWRFLNEASGGSLGRVRAIWADTAGPTHAELEVDGDQYLLRRGGSPSFDVSGGPMFIGPGGTWLMDQLVEGPLLDLVERVAYSVADSVPNIVKSKGSVSVGDVPPPDGALVSELALLAQQRLQVRAPQVTTQSGGEPWRRLTRS
jgi:hypothetical protein